ncbi:MAG: hypothetical protein ACI4DX_02655 [Oliverpabstia sp.]
MSDKTDIMERELRELMEQLGNEAETEASEEEIVLGQQESSDDWEEEIPEVKEEAPDLKEIPEVEEEALDLEEVPEWESDAPGSSKEKTEKRKKKRRKMPFGLKVFLTVIMGMLLVLVILAAIVTGIYISGKQQMTDSGNKELLLPENVQAISEYRGQKITYEGQIYRLQQEASHVLFIGKNTDGAYSMVLMNFNSSTGKLSAMPIPRELLNLDFSSAMYYTDMQDAVSRLLYGLPVHGYMVVDMQKAAEKTGQILSNTASDQGCIKILLDFIQQTMKDADNDITSIWKTVGDMQDQVRWDMDMTELCYLYITAVDCAGSEITEARVQDSADLLPAILETFYSAS